MLSLPTPEVLHCDFDEQTSPHTPAMSLRWDADAPGVRHATWNLPGGLVLQGPAPTRFGVTVVRQGDDAFDLRVVWNDVSLHWPSLKRRHILASSLSSVLGALGTDLWHLLDQPVETRRTAA